MNIKEILLAGGIVSFDYKEDKNSWMGTAKIISFCGGFGMKPSILVEIPTMEIEGRKSFEYSKIDEAIKIFKRIVFNEKNLCFKRYEAIIEIDDCHIDLDEDKDYERMEEMRKKLIL